MSYYGKCNRKVSCEERLMQKIVKTKLANKSQNVEIVGCMDHTIDHTFESANRVYDVMGICPTIPTCAGGNIQPKILVRA